MPLIEYQTIRLRAKALTMIQAANEIIAEYQGQGFDLTLRQLFYQFVSRDLIPNTQRDYKNLGSVINDGRLGGAHRLGSDRGPHPQPPQPPALEEPAGHRAGVRATVQLRSVAGPAPVR